MKKCSKCAIEKPYEDFYKNKSSNDGYNNNCKTCHNGYTKSYSHTENGKIIRKRTNNSKYWTSSINLYARAKASAKQHGKTFTITKMEYDLLINKPCYYCDNLLSNEKNRGIGLDRINNSIGYEPNNVVRCCGFCNKTRGDRLSVEEMKDVARFLISRRGQ